MNYLGVLYKEEGVMVKIVEVYVVGKFVDGYVFGLKGQEV